MTSPMESQFRIEQGKLSDVLPDAQNANKHTARGQGTLERSLRKRGFFRPTAAFGKGVDKPVMGAGNLTQETAIACGMDDAIFVYTDGTKPIVHVRTDIAPGSKEAVQLALEDNRTAELSLSWDVEVLAGLDAATLDGLWTADELSDLGQQWADAQKAAQDDPGAQVDKAEELQAKWNVKPGDLWQLGAHRLICGDCTDAATVARVMGGEKADCVFTSPPYAVGIDYGETYEDNIDNLRAMLPKLALIWHNVVCDGGFAVINFGDVLSGKSLADSDVVCEYPMALEYWPVFRGADWTLWSRRVWCKPGAAVGSSRHCIGTNRAASNFEHVWTWKRRGKPIIDDQISGDWPSQAGWFDTTHENKLGVGLKDHGAGMPPTVAERGVFWHSRSTAIVHEPFCGTGTTLIACERLSRKCRAIEIAPKYCAVALERWATMTGQTPTLVSGNSGVAVTLDG